MIPEIEKPSLKILEIEALAAKVSGLEGVTFEVTVNNVRVFWGTTQDNVYLENVKLLLENNLVEVRQNCLDGTYHIILELHNGTHF